ncbi:MAG: flagellar protein FlgN [Natronospirillum sp.]|uniref:flagellar export chaperone FlgN n=1 Tax=Natronospirillum sp. TaxID=2812955 RepID=UPI0025EE1CA4|nr:flagellar export chaperone FlgN [Natronospirillum sp.]MCH8552840.1 flagellar protein FlgN [Natronospirillum sp.]
MNWHPEQLHELQDRLDTLAVAARQMLAVLSGEYDSLAARNAPSPELLHEKARLAGILESEKATFDAFRATLHTEHLEEALRLATDQRCFRRWADVRHLLEQCDYHNEVNGRLLNRLHARNRLFDRILRQQVTDPTYSRHGQLADGRQGSLGKA